MNWKHTWIAIVTAPLTLALTGCDPMEHLYSRIRDAGYIVFQTPLAHAGPGTLVGGAPDRLSLVAPPERCFPREIDGIPTGLVIRDDTVLPERHHRLNVSGDAKFKLIDFMENGDPVLQAGVGFGIVETIDLKMEGVHVEYMDSVRLVTHYRHEMSAACKDFLDHVGFIIQAMQADRLVFEFYRKSGAAIELDLENIDELVDLGVDIGFEIEDRVRLVINTPKYIGYQLGRLRFEDEGMALYRASRISGNRYVFESLDLFNTEERLFTLGAPVETPHLIDPHAIYPR